MKKIEITPEWILDKLSLAIYLDENLNVVFQCDANGYAWIDLAANSIEIPYTEKEIEVNDLIIIEFKFNTVELIRACPGIVAVLEGVTSDERIIEQKNKIKK